jgi:hypothetical protein
MRGGERRDVVGGERDFDDVLTGEAALTRLQRALPDIDDLARTLKIVPN